MLKEKSLRNLWNKAITDYQKLTGNPVYIWDYLCYPLMTTQAPIHFPRLVVDWHRENQGRIEGDFVDTAGKSIGRTYALDHLTIYFWLKAMWNPSFDVGKYGRR